jgi:O-antigen/teichoic acid export membrane protein
MIIELLGPPGSGKTTFAHELARRLRARGHGAKVMLSYVPRTIRTHPDFFGIVFFLSRMLSITFSTLGIIVLSNRRWEALSVSNTLVSIIPPANRVWRIRLWLYILQLTWRWKRAQSSSEIIIFDQGFVQAVSSLAMLHGSADAAKLADALNLSPKSDIGVRITMPLDIVEKRLRARILKESAIERLFDADISTSLKSVSIFEQINGILAQTDRKMVSVESVDSKSMNSGVSSVETAVINMLATSQCQGPSLLPQANAAAAPAVPAMTDRRLARGSVFALAIYIGGAGLTSMAQLLIARLIGPTSYGIYSYSLAWVTMAAYLAALGFNVSLMRFIPAYRAKGRFDLARGVIGFAAQRTLAAAVLAAVLGTLLILTPSHKMVPELRTSLLIGMAIIPFVTAYALGATVLRAFGEVVSALLPERILRDGLLLALFAFVAIWGKWTLDATLVMGIVLASSIVTLALVLVLGWRAWPSELSTNAARSTEEWWSTVPPIMLIVGIDVLLTRTGVMVLGWVGNVHDAGVFALALNIALLVGLSRVAVSTMFSPSAAALYERGDTHGLQQLYSRSTLLCFTGALAIAVPLMIIIDPLLGWFGGDFMIGGPIARILILGYVATAFCGPQQNLLMMTGNEWTAARSMVVAAIANILACAVGITMYGTVGAAIGIAFAQVIWNIAMAIYIRNRLHIVPGIFHAVRLLRPA